MMIQAKTLAVNGSGLYVLALMWCPATAGFVTRLLYQRTLRGVGWRVGPWKYEWAGYWIPLAYASAVYLPLWAAGYADFHADAITRLLARLHVGFLWTGAGVLVYILIAATVGVATSCISALGEELGWRGFLVPELAKVTSFGWVGFISGAVWASWHMPLIIGADYHGANPVWYSVLCFGVMVVAMGYLFAWIRLKSGSVWPAMLLHASHNLFVQAVFDPLTRHTPFTNYTIGEFGAGLAIAVVVVALIVWRHRPRAASA
jgi:membrane protease YdiL (CAAX protease family)